MPTTKKAILSIITTMAFLCGATAPVVVSGNPTRDDSVHYVSARIIYNTYAQISWSMSEALDYDDFETGDFSLHNWNNTISDFPWVIDTTHAYQGRHCMKSTCEGHGNGISEIEISYYVPADGTMSFSSKVSSESPFDVGRFYIDGVKQFECSGESEWGEHRFDITQGIHWFRWSYLKDASFDNGDDCFYVDQINFIENDSLKERELLYFSLFRKRHGGDTLMIASHFTDSSFIDMGWQALPWGQYSWGVSCTHSGEPPVESAISWSNILDKDMTTTLEVHATTNTGHIPAGASIYIEPYGGQGESYSAQLDNNGHFLFPDIYRGLYTLQMHLDGFDTYVSDSAINIMGPSSLDIVLQESTFDLDSLYVSSTGWAMWQVPSGRTLQGFEIALNGTIVGTTTDQHFQFNEDTLTIGQTYHAAVRPVFQSWTGAWATCDFTYRSCQDFTTEINLISESINEGTLLSWTYPETDSLLGAIIFHEDEHLGFRYLGFTTDNQFIDTLPFSGPGIYWWHVRIVYGGEQNNDYFSMSCPSSINIVIPLGCDAPDLLTGTTYYTDANDYGALISWGPQPIPVEEWLYYDNGIYHRSIGTEDGAIFWGIKFEPEELSNYEGCSLTQISLYDIEAGTYQLLVYQGGATQPSTLAYYQNLALEGTHGWSTIATDSPIPINPTEPLWVVIGQQGIAYPAAVCTGAGLPNGRWVSLDGTHWEDLAKYNLSFAWMLRAFVTDRIGKSRQINDEGSAPIGYKLYRGLNGDDYNFLAQIPHIEGEAFYQYRDNLSDMPRQTYYYQLTAIYNDGCESEPGSSAHDPSMDYVAVEPLWNINGSDAPPMRLYPNPTTGNIKIEAQGIRKVSITDAMGQKLIALETQAEALTLDLSSLADGLYLISVITQEGLVTKAFMLAR